MSTTATATGRGHRRRASGQVDLKLEVVTIPVSDLDRAKEFYEGLGWRLDADFKDGDDRAVQFTPPGSQCSIHLGKKGAPDRLRACSWSSPTSRPRATTWCGAVSR